MTDPTGQEVKDFWAFMQQRFGSVLLRKDDAVEMKVVAEFLDRIGILDKDEFTSSYATTITNRIYVPFEVGVASDDWSLWDQVCVCVHEHHHVVQYGTNRVGFVAGYVASKSGRAQIEMEAYRTSLELEFWRSRAIPPTRPIADLLLGYGCRPDDVLVVDKNLALAVPTIRQGGVLSRATKAAFEWLNAFASHWRSA